MKKFKANVKHDKGTAKIVVFAESEDLAREKICHMEGCPSSAIKDLKIVPYFVTMTDKFMSNWGKAESKINKFIIECDSLEDAQTIKRNAEKRNEMKYISIKDKKPKYGKNYLESYTTFAELGEIWKK